MPVLAYLALVLCACKDLLSMFPVLDEVGVVNIMYEIYNCACKLS